MDPLEKAQLCCKVPIQLGEKAGHLYVALDLRILLSLLSLELEV